MGALLVEFDSVGKFEKPIFSNVYNVIMFVKGIMN
jgi:hypothetical protein